MSVGAAWRRKFQMPPTASERDELEREVQVLKGRLLGRDQRITQLESDLTARALVPMVVQPSVEDRVKARVAEIQNDLDRERKMVIDLKAIISQNSSTGWELRSAMASERDEAVRLLQGARARESEAREDAHAARQFLHAAQQVVGTFKEALQQLEEALGEKVDQYGRFYGS